MIQIQSMNAFDKKIFKKTTQFGYYNNYLTLVSWNALFNVLH